MELMGFTHDGRGIQKREALWLADQDCGFCADESQLHCIAVALTKAARAGGAYDVPPSVMLKRVVNATAFGAFAPYMPDYVPEAIVMDPTATVAIAVQAG